MTESDNGNGKVTMAVLGVKLDNIAAMVEKVVECQGKDHDRLGVVEARCDRLDQRQEQHHRDQSDWAKDVGGRIDRIDTREKWWSGLNSLATAVAIGLWASMKQP
jgi:hypothetical protein